jgi:hypothetical protein
LQTDLVHDFSLLPARYTGAVILWKELAMSRHATRLPGLILLLAALLPAACARTPVAPSDPGPPPPVVTTPVTEATPTEPPATVACGPHRYADCTMDYRPVCATRDTGIRCITTPCPSSEQKTFSNGCSACRDPKVSDYREGACPE